MLKTVVGRVGSLSIVVMDSISKADAGDKGAIVIAASHGGVSAGEIALMHPPALIGFNDAGIGKDRAGVAALDMLEAYGIPAVAVSHMSARIGDAGDMWRNGEISTTNPSARRIGLEVGQRLADAVALAGPRLV